MKHILKNLRESFEANLLDGDSVFDCGKCKIDAEEVWNFLVEYFEEISKESTLEELFDDMPEGTQIHKLDKFWVGPNGEKYQAVYSGKLNK